MRTIVGGATTDEFTQVHGPRARRRARGRRLLELQRDAIAGRHRGPRQSAPATAPASAAPSESAAASARAPPRRPAPTPLAPDPAEAVIPNVEPNAEIDFWTFYLSPTFDQYIKDTIARFEATYPGRQGQLGRPPGHVPGRPQQRVRRRQARPTSSTCRSARAGSATTPARASSCRSTTRSRRPSRTSTSPACGRSSWSTARTTSSRGTRASTSSSSTSSCSTRPASPSTDFPKTDRRPARDLPDPQGQGRHRLRHPPDRQRPARPDGLRGQRQGPSATTARSSPSTRPRRVAWLQMYVDMVKAGTVDNIDPDHRPTTASASRSSRRPSAVLRDRPEPRSARQGPTTPRCTATWPWSRPRSASPASSARA